MFSVEKLITYLSHIEVETIYFCCGARNASLLAPFRKKFNCHIKLDERSAAFMALGEAKVSHKPVVICTTSGTAVAECLPALVEAYYSNISLIVISADRPARLRESYAPQAIDQLNIFGKYARSFLNISDQFIKPQKLQYPFHINIEVDDSKYNLKERQSVDNTSEIKRVKTPLVIISIGANLSKGDLDILTQISGHIYIECLSSYKSFRPLNRVYLEQTTVTNLKQNLYDSIIKIGATPISKLWRLLDTEYICVPVYQVGNVPRGIEQGTNLENLSSLDFSFEEKKLTTSEFNLNALIQKFPKAEINSYIEIKSQLLEDEIVFVGNSMPIRYWQMIDDTSNKIYASRGANGIDGQLSTAIGIANSSNKKVHCIIGDLTFKYDMACTLDKLPSNLIIHIINNGGGRIFERVNVPRDIILENDIVYSKLFKHININEYFPDILQTNDFWSEYLS